MKDLWRYREVQFSVCFVVFSLVISLLIFLFFGLSPLRSLQVFFGLVYALFLPGYLILRLLFYKNINIELISLSFVVSLILVVFVFLFTNNILRIPITGFYNFIIILILIISILITYFFIYMSRRK
jgi:hypothetical protein